LTNNCVSPLFDDFTGSVRSLNLRGFVLAKPKTVAIHLLLPSLIPHGLPRCDAPRNNGRFGTACHWRDAKR